jgi:YVTN family beta-propeller protein
LLPFARLGITISPDGSTVYVANSGSSFIARLNTSTLTMLSPLTSPGGNPAELQFGNSNRLWVLNGGIHQIDATTGASAGPDLPTADIRCYDIRCCLPGKRGRPHRFDGY